MGGVVKENEGKLSDDKVQGAGEEGLSFSAFWGCVAVAFIAALAIWLPSFLMLLGFLGVIIVTHEWGHYYFAKKAGIKPTEFFWGFGPEVFAFSYKGCRYGLKVLSLGGYVKLEGMIPTSDLPENFNEAETYRSASHRGRLLTILAGPFVNILSAVVAYTIAAMMGGASLLTAFSSGMRTTWFVMKITATTIGSLFINFGSYVNAVFGGEASTPFMSPISQSQMTSTVVESGLASSLQWFAILACSIGFLNLLPLPPLDGSHAMVSVIEGIIHRVKKDTSVRLNVKKLVPLAYVTLGSLVFISVTALIVDFRNLYS